MEGDEPTTAVPVTEPPARAPSDEPWLTVPNLITLVRLLGCAAILILAWRGAAGAFLVVVLVLLLSDWVDGKVAKWLDQATRRGALIDGVVDKILYLSIVPCLFWLRPEAARQAMPYVAAAILGWQPALVISLVRFRRVPAYHTLLSKACWLLVTVGLALFFAEIATWPFLFALVVVVVAGLEATAISLIVPRDLPSVPTVLDALRVAREER